jgi:predicted ribosomally synthesized peptide with nif11-like leader
MSKQAVLSFILKVNEDKSLYEKVNSLPSSRVEALMDVAHDAGFDFTADEFVNTVLEQSRRTGELQEEDLEQVAGGAVDTFYKYSSMQLNFTVKFTDYHKFG